MNPKIFERAAKYIFYGTELYACHAIKPSKNSVELDLFEEYFKPKYKPSYSAWMGTASQKYDREHRIITLLFMQEITKDLL
jgi:hypothetical protein